MVGICEVCDKRVEPVEALIVEGSYPKESQIFSNTHYKNRTVPESYGKIYHKKCFEEYRTWQLQYFKKNCG